MNIKIKNFIENLITVKKPARLLRYEEVPNNIKKFVIREKERGKYGKFEIREKNFIYVIEIGGISGEFVNVYKQELF